MKALKMLNKLDTVQSGHKRQQTGDSWGHKKALNWGSEHLGVVAMPATN